MPLGAAVALAALAATVVGVAVWLFFAWQVRAAAARLDQEPAAKPRGFDHALSRLERTVVRARADHDEACAERDRLVAVLDALPQGVVIADAQGRSVLRNRAAQRLFGDRTADALVEEAVGAVLRAAQAGEKVGRRLDLYGPPPRTVELTAAAVAGGGVVVEVEDVTDRVRLEAMRRDFVANISHELRTPVGAIALLAETLADEDEPDVARRLSDQMVKEAHRVSRMVDDLLELSTIEQGDDPGRVVLSLGLVVSEASDRIGPLAQERDVKVRELDSTGDVSLLGERRQLVSALANLLDNAVRYSEPGSEVEIEARVDGGWVEVDVVDHGIGIPARELDRVFERFYRVDRARSRETGGTGLGLAIVRHVATNHGGSVAVRSTEGVGSTFTLRLPGVAPGSAPEPGEP